MLFQDYCSSFCFKFFVVYLYIYINKYIYSSQTTLCIDLTLCSFRPVADRKGSTEAGYGTTRQPRIRIVIPTDAVIIVDVVHIKCNRLGSGGISARYCTKF